MARARNIKPGFFTNDVLSEVHPLGRILFAGLWTLADREGRLEDRPKKIKAEVLPFDNCDANKLLGDLDNRCFIKRYVFDAIGYIQITNWKKHQNPHIKEAESTIPAPCKNSANPVSDIEQAPEMPKQASGKPEPVEEIQERAGLIPDSGFRIPDSLNRIPDSGPSHQEPKAVNLSCVTGEKHRTDTRGTRLPADWTLPNAWGEWALAEYPNWTQEGVRTIAAQFADHWKAKPGSDAKRLDWLATWRNWCRNDITQRSKAPSQVNGKSVKPEPDYVRAGFGSAAEAAKAAAKAKEAA